MTTGRRRVKTPELKKEIKARGLDAVNSDEEGNPYLDENQQEVFVTQMTFLVEEYISRWRSLFAWISVLVIYVHGACIVGLCPWTRPFASLVSSSASWLAQLFFSPFSLGSAFYHLGWVPFAIASMSIACDANIIRTCMQSSLATNPQSLLRHYRTQFIILSILTISAWVVLAHAANLPRLLWGKHTVLMIVTPLLGLAGDTFVSSKILAVAGLEKLNHFKYNYKKL